MQILSIVALIAALACWIKVLIQMFKEEKVILGILGIFCGLWAFIWGWMNVAKVGQNIMIIWTIAALLGGFTYNSIFSAFSS